MINGSFVFGLDGDDRDVFARTVDWAVTSGITTATFHILTPYPGTSLYARMAAERRIVTNNWDRYDTRHVVYRPMGMTPGELKDGYDWSYGAFYRWSNILKAAVHHQRLSHRLRHLGYSAGWKKFEPAWDVVIRMKQLSQMRPLLEAILSRDAGPTHTDTNRGRLSSTHDSPVDQPLMQMKTRRSFAGDIAGT